MMSIFFVYFIKSFLRSKKIDINICSRPQSNSTIYFSCIKRYRTVTTAVNFNFFIINKFVYR